MNVLFLVLFNYNYYHSQAYNVLFEYRNFTYVLIFKTYISGQTARYLNHHNYRSMINVTTMLYEFEQLYRFLQIDPHDFCTKIASYDVD